MALLKYFSPRSASLPDPNGPLSAKVKPEAIEKANKKVSTILASCSSEGDSTKQQRGSYQKFTPKQRAEVASYAMETASANQL